MCLCAESPGYHTAAIRSPVSCHHTGKLLVRDLLLKVLARCCCAGKKESERAMHGSCSSEWECVQVWELSTCFHQCLTSLHPSRASRSPWNYPETPAGLATASVMILWRPCVGEARLEFKALVWLSWSLGVLLPRLRPPLAIPSLTPVCESSCLYWVSHSFSVGPSDPHLLSLLIWGDRTSSLRWLPSYQEPGVSSSQKTSRPFSLWFQR